MSNQVDLLEKVSRIAKKNREIEILKGEHFNIFSILGLTSKENDLHSKFLKELLNPRGSHAMNSLFLSLFIDYIKNNTSFENINPKNLNFNLEKTTANTEIAIGKVDLEKKTGGRLDIVIKDDTKQIIIENKIFTIEGNAQIERYRNYASPNDTVFYLTLDGRDAESSGNYEANKHYFLLSYSKDIIEWLESCQKAAYDHPIVRETIKQYIISIKQLTNQSINKEMDLEIKKLILSDDYFSTAKLIQGTLDKIEKDKELFWNDVKGAIKKYSDENEKKWKFDLNSASLLIDILGHGRRILNLYIQDIYSTPFCGIWMNNKIYDEKQVGDFIKKSGLNEWNIGNSSGYIFMDSPAEPDFDLSQPKQIAKLYDPGARQVLLNIFVEKVINHATKYESVIQEIDRSFKKTNPEDIIGRTNH